LKSRKNKKINLAGEGQKNTEETIMPPTNEGGRIRKSKAKKTKKNWHESPSTKACTSNAHHKANRHYGKKPFQNIT